MKHYHKALLAIIVLSSCYFKLDSYGLAAIAIALIFVDPVSSLLNSLQFKYNNQKQIDDLNNRLNDLSSRSEESAQKVTQLYNASTLKELTGMNKR